ncbi:hypothetical protein [Pedobacter frigoris]|uniref:Uncharacterized protein n=1 Tax=Pedobacter frigoris TaxID=2571272 RepID=A0A4U1CC86_9SPHI|nr:hypothetical protein [Pedobacter frigoris]TKC03665.1 hypothetical protein FA047_19055 [Pedobacter frigoris]
MKNNLLLPSRYKIIGWITFLVFAILGYFTLYNDFEIPGFAIHASIQTDSGFGQLFSGGPFNNNFTNELAILGTVSGLLMVCLARHKNEDEYIAQLRLKAWQWSVLISYILFIIINFAFYGMAYYMIVFYNSYTILIIFIAKFHYSMYKLNKQTETN